MDAVVRPVTIYGLDQEREDEMSRVAENILAYEKDF